MARGSPAPGGGVCEAGSPQGSRRGAARGPPPGRGRAASCGLERGWGEWPSLTPGAASCRGRTQCSPPHPAPSPPPARRSAAQRPGRPRVWPISTRQRAWRGRPQTAGWATRGRKEGGGGGAEGTSCLRRAPQTAPCASRPDGAPGQQRGARAGEGAGREQAHARARRRRQARAPGVGGAERRERAAREEPQ